MLQQVTIFQDLFKKHYKNLSYRDRVNIDRFEQKHIGPYLDGVLYTLYRNNKVIDIEQLIYNYFESIIYKDFFIEKLDETYNIKDTETLKNVSKFLLYKRYIRFVNHRATEIQRIESSWKNFIPLIQ